MNLKSVNSVIGKPPVTLVAYFKLILRFEDTEPGCLIQKDALIDTENA